MTTQEINSVIAQLKSGQYSYSTLELHNMLKAYQQRKAALPGLIGDETSALEAIANSAKRKSIESRLDAYLNDYQQADDCGNRPKYNKDIDRYSLYRNWYCCKGGRKRNATCHDHNKRNDQIVSGLINQLQPYITAKKTHQIILANLTAELSLMDDLISATNTVIAVASETQAQSNREVRNTLARHGETVESVNTEAVTESANALQKEQTEGQKEIGKAKTKQLMIIVGVLFAILIVGAVIYQKLTKK